MKKPNEKAETQLLLKADVISRSFIYSFFPKGIQTLISKSSLLEKEIAITEKKLGKDKATELLNKFKNESYEQAGVNSDYVIDKLRKARNGL